MTWIRTSPALARRADRRVPPPAPIWHVLHVDAGHHLEQLASDVGRASIAGRCHVDLAGIGVGVGDELGNGLDRNRWIHLHHVGHADDARDRRDFADEIIIELVVERRVSRVGQRDQKERIAGRVL
jgi:hypothetical protein